MRQTFIASRRVINSLLAFYLLFANSFESYGQDVLFGMTRAGGMYNRGVAYQINTDGTVFNSYQDFNGVNAGSPGDGARLSQISERRSVLGLTTLTGHFVGLTESGYLATLYGNRVEIIAGTSGLFPTPSFRPTATTGTNPSGGLLATPNGRLYGVMSTGGQYSAGTLFYTLDALAISSVTTVLANFNGTTTGRSPRGTPILGRDGKLYGMTESGGALGLGVIFSFDVIRSQQTLVKLIDFDGIQKGSNPTGSLIQASNGRLYGMTKNGGTYGDGVVFSIEPDGSDYKKLLDLNGIATGSHPIGSLVEFTNGYLYGMTSSGGAYDFGSIFRVSPAGAFTKLVDFNGDNGKAPGGDLLIDTEGTSMYGTTYAGGSNDQGVLFRLQNGSLFTKLFDYTQSKGSNPVGSLSMRRKQFKMTIEPVAYQTAGSPPFAPTVSSEVDLPVYFVSADTSIVAVRNNKLIFKTSGSTMITAIQPGNHEYMGNQATFSIVVNKALQTIKFDPLPTRTYGDAPFTLVATTSSGLPVKFIVSTSSLELIGGNKVTIKGAGHFTVTAQQAGDGQYEAAPIVEQHLFVDRATQTVTFSPAPISRCCNYFNLIASSSSGLPVQFNSSDLTKLWLEGSSATPLGAGSVMVTAYQPGNSNYKPHEKQAAIEIAKAFQSIVVYDDNTPRKVGDSRAYFSPGSSSNLPVTFVSEPPGIAVVENGYLYFLAAGTTTITATQAGNAKYFAATSLTRTVTVGPATLPGVGNIISFPDLQAKTVVDPPFNLTGTATSGLPVTYTSSNPSVATIVGNLVTIKGTGTAEITANQIGNDTLAAATPVVKTLQVEKRSQHISFYVSSSSVVFGTAPIPLPTTTNEGLPISYTLSNSDLASIANNYLILKRVGKLTITASQPGNDLYLAAAPVIQTLNIIAAQHSVYFKPVAEKTYGDAPFDLEAWSSAGVPVTFESSNRSIADVAGTKVTIHSAGTVMINASSVHPGYQEMTAQMKLVIRKASQSISFPPLQSKSKKFGDPPFSVEASATSDLRIIWTTTTPGVVRVDGPRVAIVGSGTAEIQATQPGDINFEPAASVSQKIIVSATENIYEIVGTSLNGGPKHSGVVFTLSSSGTPLGYLKQFDAIAAPDATGFIKGADGKLYGTFRNGGTGNSGSVVRVEANGTGFVYLHHMSGADGANPFGNLTWAADGYLYGTNSKGGTHSGGTLFRVKPDGTEFKVIWNYDSFTGSYPNNVVQRPDGKLYGFTQRGGFYNVGTIYMVNTDGSAFSVLYHLKGTENGGGSPPGSLIQGPDGSLYGVNDDGGSYGYGTLFGINLDGTGIVRILDFNGTTTGGRPGYELLMGSDNRFYGMTVGSNANQPGTIYGVNSDGTNFTELHRFEITGPESLGSNPVGKLIEGADGYLYGTTGNGNSDMVLFRLNKDGSEFSVISKIGLTSYPGDGPIVESTPGIFFGVTRSNGTLNRNSLFSATTGGDVSLFGDFPRGQISPQHLISDLTGDYYYGISQAQSEIEGGNIFRINANTNAYEVIHEYSYGTTASTIFCASTGHIWVSGLSDGINYLFRMNPDGTGREDHAGFNSYLYQQQRPVATMTEVDDGRILGITRATSWDPAILFVIKNDGKGSLVKLATLPGAPTASLLASDRNFYFAYDENGSARICRMTQGGEITTIFDHPYPGDNPHVTKLIELNGGRLAAVAAPGGFSSNGAPNRGSIFSLEKDGKDYREIYGFQSSELTSPVDMIQSMDGWIYVVSKFGGTHGKGLIYKILPDGSSLVRVREFDGDDAENPTGILFKRAAQSFTFDPLPEKKVFDPSFLPSILSSSGAPVELTSTNPEVAVVEDGKIKPVGEGMTVIVATMLSNANFYSTVRLERQLTVTKATQTITFDKMPKIRIQHTTVELNASSTSGLPVTFESSDPAIATVSGLTLTLHRTGSVTITAFQKGSELFKEASIVSQLLTIYDAEQVITFNTVADKVLGTQPFELFASSTAGLKVSFTSNSDKVSIEGSSVTLLKAGRVTIKASQDGDDNYDAAPQIEISFCINPPKPVITFTGQLPEVLLRSSNETGNLWYQGMNALDEDIEQSLLVTEEGSYAVVTSIEGCESERSFAMEIVTTAIEDVSLQVNLYPNPNNGKLHVDIPHTNSGNARIELFDAKGSPLAVYDVRAGETSTLDLIHFRGGVLLMKITLDELVVVRKVLKY